MKNMKVKNIIIGKQYELCSNYEDFINIVKEKNIKLKVVEAYQRINIEENLYFYVLAPNSNSVITENTLNNNSLVCKLIYKDFSMLFTGDIEEKAESQILEKYSQDMLQSSILKVAHHGSKTSSTEKFLNYVKPKVALIGVGKDNNFGHPNKQVLERLKNMGVKVYRTDKMGEIIIKVNRKAKIEITKSLK